MKNMNIKLSRYVRRERKRRRMTGARVEQLSGGTISLATLSRLETDAGRWNVDHIEAVAAAFDMRPAVFLHEALAEPDEDLGNEARLVQPHHQRLLEAVDTHNWEEAVLALAELVAIGSSVLAELEANECDMPDAKWPEGSWTREVTISADGTMTAGAWKRLDGSPDE